MVPRAVESWTPPSGGIVGTTRSSQVVERTFGTPEADPSDVPTSIADRFPPGDELHGVAWKERLEIHPGFEGDGIAGDGPRPHIEIRAVVGVGRSKILAVSRFLVAAWAGNGPAPTRPRVP